MPRLSNRDVERLVLIVLLARTPTGSVSITRAEYEEALRRFRLVQGGEGRFSHQIGGDELTFRITEGQRG